jgi:hypothetical protein
MSFLFVLLYLEFFGLGAFVISCYLIDAFVIGVFCAYVYLSFPGMFFSSQNLLISLESSWEMLLIRILFFQV